ncbi:MAG: hypothetical protein ACE5R6_15715 [Candidatus Heimdallarchaeota archaeon]
MKDHIAILDEMTKNAFVGDALGYKVGDQAITSFIYVFLLRSRRVLYFNN